MAYHLIAQTESKQHLNDAYQLFIYQELASAPGSVASIDLVSDYELTRGDASIKNKKIGVSNTQIVFTINDIDRFLVNTMENKKDSEFKGVIKKNGNVFFTGYLTYYLSKYLFTQENSKVKLTLYDGIKTLSEYKVKDLTVGYTKLKDIFRSIFNALGLEINIEVYQNLYTGYDLSLTDSYASHLIYVKPEYYLHTIDEDCTYLEMLNALCNQFNYNITQENGVWCIRQLLSIIHNDDPEAGLIVKETINHSSGAYSVSFVKLDREILRSQLTKDSVVVPIKKIDIVKVNNECFSYETIAKIMALENQLNWLNPSFKDSNTGWTTTSGTPVYKNESVYLDQGDEIYQETGSTDIASGETIKIKLSATSIRMVFSSADALTADENPLFKIIFTDGTTTYYLRQDTLEWSIFDNWFGIESAGRFFGASYLSEYTESNFILDLEIAVPTGAPGKLKIICLGGGNVSGNNYPFEQGAIINYALVTRKLINENNVGVVPLVFNVSSKYDDEKEILEYDIPFSDFIPYAGAMFGELRKTVSPPSETINRTSNWEPFNKPLVEIISEITLRQNQEKKGYDINVAPGVIISYIDLIGMDLENSGTDSYYLPIYEERKLLSDHKRFLLLPHNYSTATPTVVSEFIFPDVN